MKLTVNKEKCPQNHKCPSIAVCPKEAITQKDIYSLRRLTTKKYSLQKVYDVLLERRV